jgi:Cys-rich repeat protein
MSTFAHRATPLFLLALVCCGGSTSSVVTSNDGGGTVGDSGGPNVDSGPNVDGGPGICGDHVSGTPTGRPTATQCAPSTILPPPGIDAGPLTCASDADCTSSFFHWCRAGKCQEDQCLTDSDCATGQACACADEQIGNAQHTNQCTPTQCRVDADCGAGQVCSGTEVDLCSGAGPFFACHSAADTCRVDADCCPSAPACRYEGTLGHWACAAVCTVSG